MMFNKKHMDMLYGSPKVSLTLPGNGSGCAGGVRAV